MILNRIDASNLPSTADLAWLLGFFEGEGCLCVRRRSPHSVQVELSFVQVDPAPLRKVCVILRKLGVRASPKMVVRDHQAHNVVRVYSREGIYRVLSALKPYAKEDTSLKSFRIFCVSDLLENLLSGKLATSLEGLLDEVNTYRVTGKELFEGTKEKELLHVR